MQLPASFQLSGILRHHLSLQGDGSAIRKLRLFADGNTSIVFNASPSLTLHGQTLPEAFLYGQITRFKDIDCRGPVRLFVVVFRPDGFHRLFGLPAAELNDKVISLTDLLGDRAVRAQQSIADAATPDEKARLAEAFFKQLLDKRPQTPDPTIATSLQLIQQHNGLITIRNLTDVLYCHPRQLERQFNNSIGLSPKQFCNIVRTHAFLKHLNTHSRLTGKAYESGFYDQAHLIRQFKNLTGLTPSQYLRKTDPLAVNFLGMTT